MAAAAMQPRTIVTVDPSHRLIEGVASDGRRIWLSSLIDREILACASRCKTLATLPTGLHPFAIAWDGQRKRLWVAADCPPNVPFIRACERGALLAYDTRGRLKKRILPAVGKFHPGDVSATDGEIFVSDSQSGAVFMLTSGGRALSTLVLPGTGKSAQGSAFDAATNRLIERGDPLLGGVSKGRDEMRRLELSDEGLQARLDSMPQSGGAPQSGSNGAK